MQLKSEISTTIEAVSLDVDFTGKLFALGTNVTHH
jgi:hypothetical protein